MGKRRRVRMRKEGGRGRTEKQEDRGIKGEKIGCVHDFTRRMGKRTREREGEGTT